VAAVEVDERLLVARHLAHTAQISFADTARMAGSNAAGAQSAPVDIVICHAALLSTTVIEPAAVGRESSNTQKAALSTADA
jgi:hypothetical protein